MKYKNDKSYKNSFYLAVILHIILAILLGIKIATHEKQSSTLNETQIVQAFSVNNVTNKPTEITTPKKPEPMPKELPTPPKPETPVIEQLKEEKKPEPKPQDPKPQEPKKTNNDLEKALHEKMLQDQQAEIQAISKELEKKKKQQEQAKQQEQEKKKQEQQKKEKQLLHDALANELAKEDSKVTKQIEKTKTQQTSKTETKTDDKAEENNNNQTSSNTNTNSDNPANQQNSAVIDKYKSLIIQAIAQEWIVPDDLDKNLVCKLLINVGPGGVVLRVQITQPSGNPLLDRSAQNAVLKASPLPVPKETSLLDNFRTIQLTVKPNEIT